MFPVLETDRLILRQITESDTKDIFSILSQNEVTSYYGQESMKNMEQAKEFIRFFEGKYHENRGIRWGIERKSQKGLIGTIGLDALVPNHKRADVGYEIHPDHWRKGYASEAVSRVLSYGFHTLGLRRIGAVVFPENIASIKLLEKMGFQKEGLLENYIFQNGVSHDSYVFSVVNVNA
ncbi:MAG: GNAT family N-acetyltransferase [Bacillota bacterium]|nr:GNAT family N-acetyltransferase [Bacillota bacterium]